MAHPEKQAWLFLAASLAAGSFSAMRMLDGAAGARPGLDLASLLTLLFALLTTLFLGHAALQLATTWRYRR